MLLALWESYEKIEIAFSNFERQGNTAFETTGKREKYLSNQVMRVVTESSMKIIRIKLKNPSKKSF